MDLNKELKKLESLYLQSPHRVFTMYLNTDPADPGNLKGKWQIHFKNAMQNFENYLEKDDDSDEKHNFWNVKEKVERFVQDEQPNFKKSVVIVAASDDSVWFAKTLQMPVENEFHWEETAKLDQLRRMQEEFPKTGIILIQQEEIKCIDANLGSVNDTKVFELDLDTEDWRLHEGAHLADRNMGTSGAKSSKQDEFKDRFEAHRERWYKQVAPKLDKLAKDNGWQRIYLVGAQEETDELENAMNKPVEDKVNKNLLNHEETKVIEEVVFA